MASKKRLSSHIQQKEIITVAFQVLDLSCWKCDSVFHLMMQHPRFRPVIWIIPEKQIFDKEETQRILAIMKKYFSSKGYTVAEYYTIDEINKEYSPDIIFLAKGPSGVTPWNAHTLKDKLVCYVPYCYQNTRRQDFNFGQECQVWRNFYATKNIKKIASRVMLNGGLNISVVGSPVADNYLFAESSEEVHVWRNCGKEKKRIIWAPHWSVGSVSWFNVSTFDNIAEGMLELIRKFADKVQWAFKPHPLLRDTLYKHPNWGKQRTDAYYSLWETLPNTQLENGAYVDLFKQSDAMIHDSGSFIMEYLLVNKPCMYLQRTGGFEDFNDDTIKALECYQKGATIDDVESFILNLLSNPPDPMAEKRAAYRKKYLTPPDGQSCAQLIVNELLNGR